MRIWNGIKTAVATGLVALVAGCANPNEPAPVSQRNISFNKTLFANNTAIYTPTITGDYDEAWHSVNGGSETNSAAFAPGNNDHGTLTYRLEKFNQPIDNVAGATHTVHKGEVTTDGELNTALTAKLGAGKITGPPTYNYDPDGAGPIPEVDANFTRTSDGQIYFIVAVGNNTEESYGDLQPLLPPNSYARINKGEDIATKIDQILP